MHDSKSPEELIIMREAGASRRWPSTPCARPSAGDQHRGARQDRAEVIHQHGATAAFLGYPPGSPHPFPATATISINDELVHGIPREDRILQEGDIVSLDCGAVYKGYVGDSAITVPVGAISPEAQRLLEVTERALWIGIDKARAGNLTSDISRAVQAFVEGEGYSVVREYTGHGVGRSMHEEPQVPNWWPAGRPRVRGWNSVRLAPGITFAIEPMVNVGRPETGCWTIIGRS